MTNFIVYVEQLEYEEYEVGTGNVITIKKFVDIVKKATNSSTNLNFGGKDYRQNEIMTLQLIDEENQK